MRPRAAEPGAFSHANQPRTEALLMVTFHLILLYVTNLLGL